MELWMVAILFLVLFCIFHIFLQLMCRKWHDECFLFLRLWRSPVGEALLLILESNCIQVFLGNGFYACVQCTMSSLGLFVLGCHRRRTFLNILFPWQLPTWDSALTCLLPSLLVLPYFVGICHAIFLLCCASVLISMAFAINSWYLLSDADCAVFPLRWSIKMQLLLLCCLAAQS